MQDTVELASFIALIVCFTVGAIQICGDWLMPRDKRPASPPFDYEREVEQRGSRSC